MACIFSAFRGHKTGVLVIADLLRRRTEDGRFSVSELAAAFFGLNISPPVNISSELSRLRRSQHVLLHPDRRWALTPQGIEAAQTSGSEEADDGIGDAPAAQFAHADHTIIPSWAAPPRWVAGISRLLERHRFDSNVFCMTRFPEEGGTADPVQTAIEAARATLWSFGLTLHLATDAIVDDDLLGNVGAHMWGCRYGLGIVEDRVGRRMNHNAMIELGGMALTGRRCVILKDRTISRLPTDLSGQIYRSIDLDDPGSVVHATHAWASRDLALRPLE